ncbi:hypothetical protein [Dactylosporangium cerinum]
MTQYGPLHEAAAVLVWYWPSDIAPAGDIDLLLLDSNVTVDAALERRWTLSTDVRIQVLRRLRQEGRIGEALAATEDHPTEPMQKYLEWYLAGEGPSIDRMDLADLVCARTICEWLRPAGFDGLPDASALAARLDRLLLLQPLETLAAKREPDDGDHLGALRELVQPQVASTLAILDGAGSPATAARFLLDRARAGRPIAYLDLNRPDVRPATLLPVLLETARQFLVQFPQAADRCAPILQEWQRRLASGGTAPGWSDAFATITDGAQMLLVIDVPRQVFGLWQTVAQLQEHLPQLRICLCRRRTAGLDGRVDLPPASEVSVGRNLTMNAIRDRSALAYRVLRVLTWMAPHPLPEDVLLALSDDPAGLDDALALLASYSMISWDAGTVQVHGSARSGVRATTADNGLAEAVRVLAVALPTDLSDDVGNSSRWEALLPHIDTVLGHLSPAHPYAAALDIASGAARYRQSQGQVTTALVAYDRLVTDAYRILGPTHPSTLVFRGNRAVAHRQAGHLDQAIAGFQGCSPRSVRCSVPNTPMR